MRLALQAGGAASGMQGDWLSRRVTLLEQQVERLVGLPAEVAGLRQDMNTQFAAVRADMDAGFAAVRTDMDAGFAAVRTDMDAGLAGVRADMDAGLAGVRADMDAGLAGVRADMDAGFASVRAEMDVRFDAVDIRFDAVEQVLISLQTQVTNNQRYMLVLHEQVISRLDAKVGDLHKEMSAGFASLGERLKPSRPRPRRRR